MQIQNMKLQKSNERKNKEYIIWRPLETGNDKYVKSCSVFS